MLPAGTSSVTWSAAAKPSKYLVRPRASTLNSVKCWSSIADRIYGTQAALSYRAAMLSETLPSLEHRLEATARAHGFAAFGIAPADAAPETAARLNAWLRSEEHTSELQSLMRNSYAVSCLKKTKYTKRT